MDPLIAASVEKLLQSLATEAVKSRFKGFFKHLEPDDREKAARQALRMFAEQFLLELHDKLDLTSSLEGYQDQLTCFVKEAAPFIADWMKPETREVDLGPIERMWIGDPLPNDFDWTLVAKNYARTIRNFVKNDPALGQALSVALQQEQADSLARLLPLDPGFELVNYRDYLQKKCAQLQLSAMHATAYDRRMTLWSVFVPQSAREAAPVRDLPRELLRRLRMEGHVTNVREDYETEELREGYQSSPVNPVLEILARNLLTVVLGDPGSGKTSLLKFLVMRWVTENSGLLPIWIDLKEYAQNRVGFLKYCESGCTTFGLDARELEKRLKIGEAALYLDGLDEIFDPPTRGKVIEEITAYSSRYGNAPVVVTSRILGYEPERLRNAGFLHATLEDFDGPQISQFLTKWHHAAEDDPKERTRLVSRLERALQDSRSIRALAGNPLLVTMMAILNRNQELPRDRVELYREASRVLLHEWDASRDLPPDIFARQEKEALLRELAGAMQHGEGGLAGNLIDRESLIGLFRKFLIGMGVENAFEKAPALVQRLTERNFILCYAGADHFSFVHRTFLEYFCAAWFAELFQKKQTLTLEQLKTEVFGKHWKEESWHEVLRLIAGMVGEKQAEELILFLMEQDGRNDKLANLMLAAGCLSEVRNRLIIQATDRELLLLFAENVVRYDPPYYYSPWDKHRETGPTREKAVRVIAFVWRSKETRRWLVSVVGIDQDWIVKRAAVQELARGWKDDPSTLGILEERARSDGNFAVRQAAVQELAREWKENPELLTLLKDRAQCDENYSVRRAAMQELARGAWKDDDGTLPWLKDKARFVLEDSQVRSAVLQELVRGWKDDADTLSLVMDLACSNEDQDVVSTAVRELARGWKLDSRTLQCLKGRAKFDESHVVQTVALQELARGWKEDAETLPLLKNLARSDQRSHVKSAAVQELARGWKDDAQTLPMLKDLAQFDQDYDVRVTALKELVRGWKDNPETLLLLKDRARSDRHYEVQMTALKELARGWKDDAETLPWLKDRARFDEKSLVRSTALVELARGWKQDAETQVLLKDRVRSDEHEVVRRAAMQELARGWRDDPETLTLLKNLARTDENHDVRRAAVNELGRGWKDDPDVVAILKEIK